MLALTTKGRIQETEYLQYEEYREKKCTRQQRCLQTHALVIKVLASEGAGWERTLKPDFSLHIPLDYSLFFLSNSTMQS